MAIRTGNDGALYVAVLPDRIARIAPIAPVTCTGGCLTDAQCDDSDACTTDACTPTASRCTHAPIPGCNATTTTTLPGGTGGCAQQTGREAVSCLCAAVVAACDGVVLPRGVARRADRACDLVARSGGVVGTRRERRLLLRGATLFARAARAGGRRRVEPACGAATGDRLRAAGTATRGLLDAVRRAE